MGTNQERRCSSSQVYLIKKQNSGFLFYLPWLKTASLKETVMLAMFLPRSQAEAIVAIQYFYQTQAIYYLCIQMASGKDFYYIELISYDFDNLTALNHLTLSFFKDS